MTEHDDRTQGGRFPTAADGYDTGAVDGYLEDLETKLRELESARDDLDRQVARLRDELADARARVPEIQELHGRLEDVREEYARRTHALELLAAAAAREIGARLRSAGRPGTEAGEPLRGAWGVPEPGPPSDQVEGPA